MPPPPPRAAPRRQAVAAPWVWTRRLDEPGTATTWGWTGARGARSPDARGGPAVGPRSRRRRRPAGRMRAHRRTGPGEWWRIDGQAGSPPRPGSGPNAAALARVARRGSKLIVGARPWERRRAMECPGDPRGRRCSSRNPEAAPEVHHAHRPGRPHAKALAPLSEQLAANRRAEPAGTPGTGRVRAVLSMPKTVSLEFQRPDPADPARTAATRHPITLGGRMGPDRSSRGLPCYRGATDPHLEV